MAPEQLEGRETDARTDIFGFGLVLYEMIAGSRAFEARSQARIISSIMTSDAPPLSSLNSAVPLRSIMSWRLVSPRTPMHGGKPRMTFCFS